MLGGAWGPPRTRSAFGKPQAQEDLLCQAPATGQQGGPWSRYSQISSKGATEFWEIGCFQFCLLRLEFEQNVCFGLVAGSEGVGSGASADWQKRMFSRVVPRSLSPSSPLPRSVAWEALPTMSSFCLRFTLGPVTGGAFRGSESWRCPVHTCALGGGGKRLLPVVPGHSLS